MENKAAPGSVMVVNPMFGVPQGLEGVNPGGIAIFDDSAAVGQSNATPQFGESTTLYAVIQDGSGGVSDPTGGVQFLDGDRVIGTAPLKTANGQTYAELTVTAASLGVGSHAIRVGYDGDYNHVPAQSPTTTIIVAPNTTAAAGQDNADPRLGETITLYAVVARDCAGSAPTGSVVFLDGSKTLGSARLQTVPGQTNTSLALSDLSAGTHTITMVYTGDADHSPSVATTTIMVRGGAVA